MGDSEGKGDSRREAGNERGQNDLVVGARRVRRRGGRRRVVVVAGAHAPGAALKLVAEFLSVRRGRQRAGHCDLDVDTAASIVPVDHRRGSELPPEDFDARHWLGQDHINDRALQFGKLH